MASIAPSHIKRRWLRYSIRLLLAAVTIFGLWFGWQVQIVRERRKLMNWAADHGGYVNVGDVAFNYYQAPADEAFSGGFGNAIPLDGIIRPRLTMIPWYREILGDKAVISIAYSGIWQDEDEAARIDRYFPEADVVHTN